MTDIFDPGKSVKKRAKKANEAQARLLEEQKRKEELRLAEESSEVAKRRALIQRKGGRSLLIATSPKGVQDLGA